jgi:vesicle coat complex subunit
MNFYDLDKAQRLLLVEQVNRDILDDLRKKENENVIRFYADDDTYIRKAAYQATGKTYRENPDLQAEILKLLETFLQSDNEKIRQTAINAAGEIGVKEFAAVEHLFDKGLFDLHHSVKNAVIGSVKKMSEKNPQPVLTWAKKHLHHPDAEVRREICHGIELRGRTHPQDVLPLLKELQFDTAARVKNTLVHVLGQIAYKKGCLATVVEHLQSWDNRELVSQAISEIIDVHHRYKEFAALTPEQAIEYINNY